MNLKNIIIFIAIINLFISLSLQINCNPLPGHDANQPIGDGKGINKGRVVWVYDREATKWDGNNNTFWWTNENLLQNRVNHMFYKSITSLVGEDDYFLAWDKLFKHFNFQKTGQRIGYQKKEKIAIKINLNGDYNTKYVDNNGNEVSPQYLKALLRGLVHVAGVDEDDISIYEASRRIVPHLVKEIRKEFQHVHLIDNNGEYPTVEKVQVSHDDENGRLYFSSEEVPNRDLTFLPVCVAKAKYMIDVANFRGHDMAGITMSGKNYFGSIYRPDCKCGVAGSWCPASIHNFANTSMREMGTYNCIVDLLGHKKLGGNGLLFLSDGLYGGPSEFNKTIYPGQLYPSLPQKFQSYPFNNWWSSSIFASQDPIALDSVAFDFLRNEPTIPFARMPWCIDNYLHESALANNPPSKTIYNPDGKFGKKLNSLGVHEHFNNVFEKRYSRNMGKNYGIELTSILLSK